MGAWVVWWWNVKSRVVKRSSSSPHDWDVDESREEEAGASQAVKARNIWRLCVECVVFVGEISISRMGRCCNFSCDLAIAR
jgi:hypothetical protein